MDGAHPLAGRRDDRWPMAHASARPPEAALSIKASARTPLVSNPCVAERNSLAVESGPAARERGSRLFRASINAALGIAWNCTKVQKSPALLPHPTPRGRARRRKGGWLVGGLLTLTCIGGLRRGGVGRRFNAASS